MSIQRWFALMAAIKQLNAQIKQPQKLRKQIANGSDPLAIFYPYDIYRPIRNGQ